jgi:hypothetical protein
MADSIVQAVVRKFLQRSELGQKKYGTTLDRTDLKPLDWIQHAQEEFMDGILYLEKLKQTFQPRVTEIIDDRRPPPPSSSESEPESEHESDEVQEHYTIIRGKKRPRPDDLPRTEPDKKRTKKVSNSISTEEKLSPAESVQSAPSPINDLKCSAQARFYASKI